MELSDPGEGQCRELPLPSAPQSFALARGNGKEQLVIFAFRNGVADLCSGGKRQVLRLDCESHFAGTGETWKIDPQSVAQIHHGLHRERFCEPARFRHPRNESQMLLFNGATKLAGDEKIIANLAAPARHPAVSLDESSDADGDDNWTGRATRFAAH